MPKRAATFVAAALLLGCSRDAGRDEKLQAPSPLEIFGTMDPQAEIAVRLETTEGTVRCALSPAGAPRGVATFVGLATGRAAFRDVRTGKIAKRPYYDGLTFFRAIPAVLVQSGCPRGDGTGHPGFRFPVEARAGDAVSLRSPGALVLARYNTPPGRVDPAPPAPGDVHGSQFAITLGDMRHLAGTVTVLGKCQDLDVVARVAEARASGKEPLLKRVIVEAR